MEKEYVSREEFEHLKEIVMKQDEKINESEKLLQSIDKKIDVIAEKITSADKIDELKFKPMESRVSKVEANQDWLWKTVIGSILALAIKIIFDITK
jgi:hypothetical protein